MNEQQKKITGFLFAGICAVFTLAAAAYAMGYIGGKHRLAGERDSFGDVYSGLLVLGQFEGPVNIRFADGDAYSGGFTGGFEGRGIFTSKEGWTCEAVFKNGKVQGEALITGKSGSYRGELDNFAVTGKGIFRSSGGWTYSGDWVEGIPEGNGTFTWPGGAVYTGAFKDGLAEGRGVLSGNPYWTYDGEFSGGIRNGQGALKTNDGKTIEGTWEMGMLVQPAALGR
ncbi:MAG: hypothetical protein LBK77_00835 [Spirochaetaceae bacterium]|jgi:hypothetical protein|nr:hypothetical protein [Spirochaetaceae bacterium]